MTNLEIRYNPVLDFFYSIFRISCQETFKNPKLFKELKLNKDIEKYVHNVIAEMSPFLKADMEILTKNFSGGLLVPIYYTMQNNITSVSSFFENFKRISGDEFFELYKAVYGLQYSQNDSEIIKVLNELKNEYLTNISNEEDKQFLELKKYPEDTKKRLDNFFQTYYDKFYRHTERNVTSFMAKLQKRHKLLLEMDTEKFFSKILYVDINKIKVANRKIIIYPSYFYEIGNSFFLQDNFILFNYGYILEQRFDKDYMKNKYKELFKVLSDEKRLEILKLLSQKKWYSTELAEHFNLTKATISYHTNKLLDLGLLTLEFGENNKVFLSLNKYHFKEILDYMYDDIIGENNIES